jgi:recombination protein RecA
VVDLGVDLDIVGKAGSWYSYNGTKIAQGREAAKNFLDDNPELREEIASKVMAHYLPSDEDVNEKEVMEVAETETK